MGDKSTTKYHNCYLAVDSKTGDVLASVEYGFDQAACKLTLCGFDETFGRVTVHKPDGTTYKAEPYETAHTFLIAHWRDWVPVPWKRHLRIQLGGGSYWSNKMLGVQEWHKGSQYYSFEHAARNAKAGKALGQPTTGNISSRWEK